MRPAVLLPGLVVLVLALGGCGDDGDPAPTSSTTGAATTTTGAATATAAGGDAIAVSQPESGTGYRLAVPDGWTDATDLTRGSAIRVDRIFGARSGERRGQNLVVIRENPAVVRGKSVDDLEETVRTQAARAVGRPVPTSERELPLDGAETRAWTLRNGTDKIQRQLVAVRDDVLWTLTVTTAADRDESTALMRAIVGSWRWQ